MSDLTADNFTAQTGLRFRVSREMKERIASGALNREQAFQEWLAGGGLQKLQSRRPAVPDSVYFDPDLTPDNFSAKTEAAIGVPCRFRVSREQKARIDAGTLTREGALAEIVAKKRNQTTV